MDAPTLVSRLVELDPTFTASVTAMFGGVPDVADLAEFAFATGGVAKHDEIVAKMMPTPSDVSTPGSKPRKPKALTAPKPKLARRVSAVGPKKPTVPKAPEPVKPVTSDSVLTKSKTGVAKSKTGVAKKASVRMDKGTLKRVVRAVRTPEGLSGLTLGAGGGYAAGKAQRKPTRQTIYTTRSADQVLYGKSEDGDVEFSGTFSKFDDDKRLAFGWASVVTLDGQPVLDKQGDIIDPDEIEKAAYQYMLVSRKGGEMHKRRTGPDGTDEPVHVADIVESFVVTPEKIAKMGLPADMPQGWWVGYKVHDDEAWAKVKSGQYQGFSIHGRGRRTPVEL